MSSGRLRNVFGETGHRRWQGWGGSNSLDSASSSTPSISTQHSDDETQQELNLTPMTLSDQEMLERARATHNREDFV
ncbi:unnamed protein product [Phytophthora fragariaefolia]|uniref:Unnamed protein product n=1 Tax=Phytophthora fragariaefolia TaxID=1490495 RepID=A0A9W6TUL4_9STRA|nr:unnamed protein product [Phytophthora fragariaefolia]